MKALVYPGFATDLQSPMTSLMTQARGTSILTDHVYNNRFKHVPELQRMGAKIRVEGRRRLSKASPAERCHACRATDLRAGASLVVAALTVPLGITEITGVEYIDSGYDNLVENLRRLGRRSMA